MSISLPAADEKDPKAVEIARTMMEAMGGENAWDEVHFVRFGFKVVTGEGEVRVDRRHLWDKWSGSYRFESSTEDGKQLVVLFNVNSQKGDVYIDGAPVTGEKAAELLKSAHSAFINDSYWLAMPWKWLDPGVNLEYLGPKDKDGEAYEVVQLTFNDVGLTPGDTYRAYVSQDSHLMTYWEYTLQSDREGAWNWEYGEYNGIKLAKDHTNAEGTSINMGNVGVFDEVEEAFFTEPDRMISQLP